jgi:type IV pilus assembly protein PilE
MRANNHKGFTLVELMITVAIVAILAAVSYPSYISYVAKGRRAECRSGLLQVVQQQERYYSQFNTYVTASYSAGSTATSVKIYSGDSDSSSACTINSVACTSPGSTLINACIETRATPKATDPDAIEYLYLDSEGRKGCSISSSRTTGNKSCWP